MATVRIEGVAFEPDDAAEFAERTRRYVGAMPVALSPGIALAVQIEQRIAEGGGDVTLTEEEKRAALAVVDEWRQSRAAPDAVRELHRLLRVQIAGEASRMQDDDGA